MEKMEGNGKRHKLRFAKLAPVGERLYIYSFFAVTIPFLLYVLFLQYRHFYEVGNITFTFWKTGKGCYIMPYKYFGVTIPKNNYMKASNLGGAIIFIGEDSTLYIFPEFTYELGADTIECNLSSYNHKYFPKINELKYIESIQDTISFYQNHGYPYINIYIAEMYAQIGNPIANNEIEIK